MGRATKIDPKLVFGMCVGYHELSCALVMEQAHVSVFEVELAMDMYISYVPLVEA